ncbi:hypothetical protein DLK05_07780 [Ancylomarina longa]|uniref:Uncharacterized protein n=1 Tax=Ancylomarina longa TaxID=2487017 RepID=A0A434AVJ0_9BACT|nr:hypothetical protein DLK05_07780 [Ancylomarina longa]
MMVSQRECFMLPKFKRIFVILKWKSFLIFLIQIGRDINFHRCVVASLNECVCNIDLLVSLQPDFAKWNLLFVLLAINKLIWILNYTKLILNHRQEQES